MPSSVASVVCILTDFYQKLLDFEVLLGKKQNQMLGAYLGGQPSLCVTTEKEAFPYLLISLIIAVSRSANALPTALSFLVFFKYIVQISFLLICSFSP